ncbi:uncharacterized protein BO66DRAFT_141306 [Aspergillus aculeatinus CBS 121060]|uniref:Uncharacterized protein n=1 Tax=Aspergillus aculeatinus CBS 121060 TaxID=1448322 RepID=A0ACD1H2T1_9EURO|nr:hypothetical protein BO66DRAFT_141306 [Aspergillus aculeatinus CBS 121060]RAH67868.1 hypothetical protein BO66DRAFT_141306 [Aspergillus aculeatinus CBS 121060]
MPIPQPYVATISFLSRVCPVSFLPSPFHLSYFYTFAKLLYFRDTTAYTLHRLFPIQCAKMSAETTIAVPPPPDQPNPTDRDVTDKEQHAAQTIQVRLNFNLLRTLSASLTYFFAQESIPRLSYAERVTRARTLAALTEHIATNRGRQRSRMASDTPTVRAQRHQRSRQRRPCA